MTTQPLNIDNIVSMQDVIERIADLRARISKVFVAGWNVPGTPPENKPLEFKSFLEAKLYLYQTVENMVVKSRDDKLDQTAFLEKIDFSYGDFYSNFLGHNYWVTERSQNLSQEEFIELRKLEILHSGDYTFSMNQLFT